MSESFHSAVHRLIIKLSEPIRKILSETPYNAPPESISVEAILEDLLPKPSDENVTESHVRSSVRGFSLACALLASSKSSDHDLLSWIPEALSSYSESAFGELSEAYSVHSRLSLVVDLMPEVVPPLKNAIKESSIDSSQDVDEISAASARTPVGLAIVAAYQFRWFVTQIGHPHLGKLCSLLIPCALTALDHWSPEVKGQGMISFIHIGKIVDTNEIGCYEGVILDACCHNIASSDEIWHLVVEMSVLFVTRTHPSNPRIPWFERILGEMLSHLERQPRNKDRRVAWLQHSEALFNSLGLLLVAHFRRIFPLFFQWMRADDDETVLLVLKQVDTILRLSWIRNTPYIERLGVELDDLYKEASLKKSCEDVRRQVSQILILLQEINAFHACEGLQFQAASDKPRDVPNMTNAYLQEEGTVQR